MDHISKVMMYSVCCSGNIVHSSHSLSIFSKASALPTAAFVVPNLRSDPTIVSSFKMRINEPSIRDEYNIPIPLLQTRFLELLEVDDFLFELILAVDDVLGRGEATAILAHSSKVGR